MSRAMQSLLPSSRLASFRPLRFAAVLLGGLVLSAAAGGVGAQEGGEAGPPADPPPAEAEAEAEAETAVSVDPPLPIEMVIVRPRPEPPSPPPAQTISLSLREADLVEVLRSFARLGGFNLVVDPSVKGTVTVELKDVRWELALAVILRTHGLAAEIDGRVVSIHPLPGIAPR